MSQEAGPMDPIRLAHEIETPGSKIVANKRLWTSYGVKKVIGRQLDQRQYVRCGRHATFVSWPRGGTPQGLPCGCEECPSEYVDPIFGFITDGSAEEPSSRPAKVFSTRPYFARSEIENPETVQVGGVATLTKASPGYLVVLCEGRKGQGFHICRECGAGFVTRPKSLKIPHKTPYGGDCSGQLDRVALGHEIPTDVVKLQFHGTSPASQADGRIWFAYSLAYAVLQGAAEALEVPSTDLSVTVKQSEAGAEIPQVILYENVPGGAGLVARLEETEIFRQCLEEAKRRVRDCLCGENTSCDGCLRSYTNQFAHTHLARGPVARYLENTLARWT